MAQLPKVSTVLEDSGSTRPGGTACVQGERGREGGREEGREGGREGEREERKGGREGEREGIKKVHYLTCNLFLQATAVA